MPFSDDYYAQYDNFDGPTPQQQWQGYRNSQNRDCSDGVQGSGGLRRTTPRHGKYSHQQIGNIRVK